MCADFKAFYDSLTPQEKVVLNDAVTSAIVEKCGPEGAALMKAFLEAIDTASK